MVELKLKKLTPKTQVDSHFQCYWKSKSWLRNRSLLIVRECPWRTKNTMVQVICYVVKRLSFMEEKPLSMTVMILPSNGTEITWVLSRNLSSSQRLGLWLLISQSPPTMVMGLQKTHLVQFSHLMLRHLKSIWRKCLSKTCMFLDLKHSWWAQNQMMRQESSSYHSIAVMTLSKSTKYVIRTQVELAAVSWKERNRQIQQQIDIIVRKISF